MIMCADDILDVLGRVSSVSSRVVAYEKAVAEEVTKARMVL